MSQENVEVVSRYFRQAALNLAAHRQEPRSYAAELERDESDPGAKALLDLFHPDITWTNPLGESFEGKLGCARWADELLNASQAYSVRAPEVDDLGGDQVLTEHRVEMTGAKSGADTTMVVFTLFTVRGGLITQMVEYFSREEAVGASAPGAVLPPDASRPNASGAA
jgi:ketosteroid isomerase-like protein